MVGNKIFILQTGVANTASVVAAFKRIGLTPYVVDDVRRAQFAKQLVVPGVGTFRAAVENLKRAKLFDALVERVNSNQPTLLICLGMQLLCEASAESQGVSGFGIIPNTVERFSDSARVPQFGWNSVEANPNSQYLQPGHAYFANSYCLRQAPTDWNPSTSTHDKQFVAAVERGNVLACQFHPELSGTWGLEVLQRWYLKTSDSNANCN